LSKPTDSKTELFIKQKICHRILCLRWPAYLALCPILILISSGFAGFGWLFSIFGFEAHFNIKIFHHLYFSSSLHTQKSTCLTHLLSSILNLKQS
jgi:hypothetical protein